MCIECMSNRSTVPSCRSVAVAAAFVSSLHFFTAAKRYYINDNSHQPSIAIRISRRNAVIGAAVINDPLAVMLHKCVSENRVRRNSVAFIWHFRL